MNVQNFIQINKLSLLHNKKNIWFCKTDFILDDFEHIKKLDYNVTFITGNSDYGITDEFVSMAPSNIKRWFAQNALSNHPILEPLPIGLENKTESIRRGHGIGYKERMIIKEKYLQINVSSTPHKHIYANFNINTNPIHRSAIKQICTRAPHIDWQEYGLSLEEWFGAVSEYKMIVCPAGNGVDTHRLWETLYLNRIPITIKLGSYKIYDLYAKLPIIVLEDADQLLDFKYINTLYNKAKNMQYDYDLLNINYWNNLIKGN